MVQKHSATKQGHVRCIAKYNKAALALWICKWCGKHTKNQAPPGSFFLLLISADSCNCTVRIYTYGRRVKSNASMFIDRLQIHSMLEDWSIDACECSGETFKVEKD